MKAVEIDDGRCGMGQESLFVQFTNSLDSPCSRGIGAAPRRRAEMPQSGGGFGRLRNAPANVSLGG